MRKLYWSHLLSRSLIARVLAPTLWLAFSTSSTATAQGISEKLNKAAQKFAAASAEAAMSSGATSLDLETRGLTTVSVGELSVGAWQIDVKDAVAVRVHVFYRNPKDTSVSVPVPGDDTFALVDDKGRRMQLLSVRFEKKPKDGTGLTVPALERVTLALMFYMPTSDASEAVLKVGTAGLIRGIPLKTAPSAPPPR